MKYTYKDFATGRPRWTRGTFAGMTDPTGPLGARYATFFRRSDTLFVPEYCLTKETRAAIHEIEQAAKGVTP